jgi:hypothetical protein
MLGLLLLGCSTSKDTASGAPEWVALLDAGAWVEVGSASADPFEDRPAEVDCSSLGYKVEGTYFEIETDTCAYGTFQQPLPRDIPAGTELELVYWHLDLWAPEEAQGHIAMRTDATMLHEAYIDIPSGAEVYPVLFQAPTDLREGEAFYFHIHNHGYNSWSLGGMEALLAP